VAGPDPFEMFAIQETGFDYLTALDGASIAGLRVAYSPDLGAPPIEEQVSDVVRQAASVVGEPSARTSTRSRSACRSA
jgi:hypothetical protein